LYAGKAEQASNNLLMISGEQAQFRTQTCACGQYQQHIHAEVFHFAFHQPGNARLRNAEPACSLDLRPALLFQAVAHVNHDLGAHFHDFGFGRVEAQVDKNIAAAFSDFQGFLIHGSSLSIPWPTVGMGLKSLGARPNCTAINSTPNACRTDDGMARRSFKLELTNLSGFMVIIAEHTKICKYLNNRHVISTVNSEKPKRTCSFV